jgi:hypothetical protein
MKNIVWRAAFSGYSFLLLKKSIWLEGIRDKTIKDDGAKRALVLNEELKYALTHTSLTAAAWLFAHFLTDIKKDAFASFFNKLMSINDVALSF